MPRTDVSFVHSDVEGATHALALRAGNQMPRFCAGDLSLPGRPLHIVQLQPVPHTHNNNNNNYSNNNDEWLLYSAHLPVKKTLCARENSTRKTHTYNDVV